MKINRDFVKILKGRCVKLGASFHEKNKFFFIISEIFAKIQ